jgi:hypothetical protein
MLAHVSGRKASLQLVDLAHDVSSGRSFSVGRLAQQRERQGE